MKHIIFFVFLSFPFLSAGIMDTRSAGYSKTFVDWRREGSGFALRIERSYNSRSLYNGIFGFGWCSNFETRMDAMPDNSLKAVECGGGQETLYYQKGKSVDAALQTKAIIDKMKQRRMSKKDLRKLEQDLLRSQTLRSDFIGALKLKGKVREGARHYASGRSNEYVIPLRGGGGFRRVLPTGISEIFNNDGRLVKVTDRQGHFIEISWKPKEILVTDSRGRILRLILQSGKVKTAKFGKKTVASYRHDGEDLKEIKNAYNETFSHDYDDFHNLTKTVYPDKTTEELRYNVKKDWVVKFIDRRGCVESYGFGKNKKNPDHYFSTVEKTCGRGAKRRVVNRSKYEFWNKPLPGGRGGKYLHRARTVVNGVLTADVTYHPKFGSPISFYRNGVRTKRDYYANGFLKEKKSPFLTVTYKNYHKKCRRPELVEMAHKSPPSKKVTRRDIISFQYNSSSCELRLAKKSDDEWIKVRHDKQGRLRYMEDQSRKAVTIGWHKTLKQPAVITRKGVGSVRVIYNEKGELVDLKAGKAGVAIMAQVTSVFNNFLQTISPVAEEMVIL